jgi:hypothetical protein
LNLNYIDQNITVTVEFEMKVGINEQLLSNARLFPNPSKGKFTIISDVKISDVKIYDFTGRIVYSQIHNDRHIEINLSDVETGLYFVKIITNEGEKMMKLQITN